MGVAEETETDLAIETSEKQKTTPHGTLLTNSLATGLAWDNYDELVETKEHCMTLLVYAIRTLSALTRHRYATPQILKGGMTNQKFRWSLDRIIYSD